MDAGGNCWIQGPVPAASSCGGSFWHQVWAPFANFPSNAANAILSPLTLAGELLAPHEPVITNFLVTDGIPQDDLLAAAVGGVTKLSSLAGENLAALGAESRLVGGIAEVNEAMSPAAAAYQSRVTGMAPGTAYIQNGVRFDGVDVVTSTLLEAKSGLGFMVNSSTGTFKSWSRFPSQALEQARRQVAAADGASIEWRIQNTGVATATRNLFQSQLNRGIKGIRIVNVQ
jgi:hypothetical protein